MSLLALQAARLFWTLATPFAPLGAAAAVAGAAPPRKIDMTVLERFDPFFRLQQASAAPGPGAAPAQGELALYGLRSDGRGGGSAIIGVVGGAQGSYLIGDDVGGGAVLRAIGADHVTLSRGSGRVRLEFSRAPASSLPPPALLSQPSAPPPPAGQVSASGLDPKQFLSAAALTPETKDGRIVGYRVMSRAGGAALARAGLQDGDVLVAIDGSPLSPERMTEIPEALANASDIEVRFERDGQPMVTRLRSAPN